MNILLNNNDRLDVKMALEGLGTIKHLFAKFHKYVSGVPDAFPAKFV